MLEHFTRMEEFVRKSQKIKTTGSLNFEIVIRMGICFHALSEHS